jgi:hypothetical protein
MEFIFKGENSHKQNKQVKYLHPLEETIVKEKNKTEFRERMLKLEVEAI